MKCLMLVTRDVSDSRVGLICGFWVIVLLLGFDSMVGQFWRFQETKSLIQCFFALKKIFEVVIVGERVTDLLLLFGCLCCFCLLFFHDLYFNPSETQTIYSL
jgi:hypothetical protein